MEIMTNKGKKYLQQLLKSEQDKTAALQQNLEKAAAHLNDLYKINTAMESDLLQVCEPHILTGVVRLVRLRKNLNRRKRQRVKQNHARQLESSLQVCKIKAG